MSAFPRGRLDNVRLSRPTLSLARPQREALRISQPRLQRQRLVATAARSSDSRSNPLTESDLKFLKRAAVVSKTSEGLYVPHPNSACLLVSPEGRIIAETHHKAEGTMSAEHQAVSAVHAKGTTAYLNLEPGDMYGSVSPVKVLVDAGVSRVVLGMLHPLRHLRGHALKDLRNQNIEVAVLGVDPCNAPEEDAHGTWLECLRANEALLHRVATRRPMSVLKYAMTLDGKIAASTGHSAWVSSPMARQEVFATRAISAAVIVGGNTVRRDNPNLTTRRESGFSPTRIVMSRTLDLPAEANLWNIDLAPTIVMTQRGARESFQQKLRDRGIEVVEFDFLSPRSVVDYCYEQGFLQLLWECGGMLSAPAIASGVIHKAMAFVCPKIIGGTKAPTPCGDLGFVEMTQALKLTDTNIQQIGPDVMITGYLPSSGGLEALSEVVANLPSKQQSATSLAPSFFRTEASPSSSSVNQSESVVQFFVAWEEWGAFSNFSAHPIRMLDGAGPHGKLPASSNENTTLWPSVEHYYQAQKFAGGTLFTAITIMESNYLGVSQPLAEEVRQQIQNSETAYEASRIGRRAQHQHSELLRPDWFEKRVEIMHEAVLEKFKTHEAPRQLLLSTNNQTLVENSPRDFFWGCGMDRTGENHLGKILMSVRNEVRQRVPLNTDNVEPREVLHS